MRSLRRRLLLGTTFVVATTLLFTAFVVFVNIRLALQKEFDDVLLERARALSALTELQSGGIELDFADTDFREFSRNVNPDYFQLWLPNGSVLERSKSLSDRDLDRDLERDRERDETNPGHPKYRDVVLPDQRRGRQVCLSFYPKIADELRAGGADDTDHLKERIDAMVTIVVAASTAEVDSMLSGVFWLLFTVSCVGHFLGAVLTLLVVRRSLVPLERVSSQIEKFDERDLEQRIDVLQAPEELVPVVNRVNDLLGRIDTLFRRERAFSAEVAHELRTPLAGLLSTIEVCLRKPRDAEKYQDVLRRCRAICRQSDTMVEGLLEIAQLEQGNVPIQVERIDLCKLLAECWELFDASATQKQLNVTWSGLAPIILESDGDKLRVILRNLMQNAVSHGDELGEIRLATFVNGEFVHVSIENTGNKVAPSEVAGIYDRLWRGDGARSQTGRHFGLGLSLVQKLVTVLQARIEISVAGEIFRAELKLPRHIATDISRIK